MTDSPKQKDSSSAQEPSAKQAADTNGTRGRGSPPPTPIWRMIFDIVERQLGPQVDSLARSSEFASFLAFSTRLESKLRRQTERRLHQYWHLWNLPAYSDIRQYAERLAALERQVRDLAERRDDRP